jgi:hypothetical protein
MSTEPSNEQVLRDAGVIIGDELPDEYQTVVDGLSEDERDTIVSVKARLDQAAVDSGEDVGDHCIAP